jgi:hypothetical protein
MRGSSEQPEAFMQGKGPVYPTSCQQHACGREQRGVAGQATSPSQISGSDGSHNCQIHLRRRMATSLPGCAHVTSGRGGYTSKPCVLVKRFKTLARAPAFRIDVSQDSSFQPGRQKVFRASSSPSPKDLPILVADCLHSSCEELALRVVLSSRKSEVESH